MGSLSTLERVVEPALAAHRVGTPVAAHLVAHTLTDHGQIERLLERAVGDVLRWLSSNPTHLHAAGSVEQGRITVLLQTDNGAIGLVSVGVSGVRPPLLGALIVGNKGVLSWEPTEQPLSAEGPEDVEPRADAPVNPVLRESLQRAIRADTKALGPAPDDGPVGTPRSGQPVRPRPAAKPPFGVLLVAGSGTHQEDYARMFADDPRCRLIGLTDERDVPPRRAELNQRLADELGIPYLTDLDRALDRPDVQIVSLCAEPERRAPIILRCAQAGKHLYLDKPLAATIDEARGIVAAVDKAGVLSQTWSFVHTPTAERARRLVASGELGTLRAVHCDLFFAKGHAGSATLGRPRTEQPHPNRFETFDAKRDFYNIGIYPLVLIQWLLGRDFERAVAHTANAFSQEQQRNDFEDFGAALYELEGGATASIFVGRTGWRSHPAGGVNQTYLIGTKGVACIDAFRPRLEVWADEPAWLPTAALPDDPLAFWKSTPARMGLRPKNAWLMPTGEAPGDVPHFLDCIEHGRESDVSVRVAAAALAGLLAGYESAAKGDWVAVPDWRPSAAP